MGDVAGCGSGTSSNSGSGRGKTFCCRLRAKTWIQIIVLYQILICGAMLTLGWTGVTESMLKTWLELEPVETIDTSLERYEHTSMHYPFTVFRFPSDNVVREHHQRKEDALKSKENMKSVSDLFLVIFTIELVMTFILQLGKYKGSTTMLYVYSGWSGLGLTILFVVCQSYGALFIPIVCFLGILFLIDIFSACAVYSHAKELSLSKRLQDHHQSTDGKYKVRRRIRPIQRVTYVHRFNGNKI